MHSESLIGLPVIHIDLGKRFGTVQSLILDPKGRRAAGMLIALGGWRKRGLLPMERVYAVGEQAVTIADEEAIIGMEEESELRSLWRRGLDLRGMQVLTVTGRDLGKVAAFTCSPDGVIETLYLRRGAMLRGRLPGTIPGTLVRSFGEDAVIVAAEAFDRLAGEAAEGAPGPAAGPPPGSVWKRIAGWGRGMKRDEPASPGAESPPSGGE